MLQKQQVQKSKLTKITLQTTPVYLTDLDILSINTIDKITHVCYTQNKLENKTNILTNHNKNKNKGKQNDHTNN